MIIKTSLSCKVYWRIFIYNRLICMKLCQDLCENNHFINISFVTKTNILFHKLISKTQYFFSREAQQRIIIQYYSKRMFFFLKRSIIMFILIWYSPSKIFFWWIFLAKSFYCIELNIFFYKSTNCLHAILVLSCLQSSYLASL